ncbi:MAG: PKD domain-containing protein [Caulobacteraceae bacterium]
MNNRVVGQKYEIVDTLFSNELQTIYVGKLLNSGDSGQFIINEFKDTDIIYSMKDNFSPEKCRYIRNIVETFYMDFNFYVVSSVCPGPTLETFLSNNSLRLTEKMYITESLLTQLVEMEKLSPFITYALCDTSNLAITNRKNICFNCNIMLSKEKMSVTGKDVTIKMGEVICTIFANTVNADLEYVKDIMPPALLPITRKCLDGKYDSIANVYSDFKSLLLYSVFMGNMSVDNQIRKNLSKARIKHKLSPLRKLAVILVALLLAGGVWAYIYNMNTDVSGKDKVIVQNNKPTAKITASAGKVYEGDSVVFTSQAADTDENDGIDSYNWTILIDDRQIFSSSNQNIAYKFEKAGKYTIQLVVSDTRSESSEPYKLYIDVLPKPENGGSKIPAANDRK